MIRSSQQNVGTCRWVYRPGTNDSHWARRNCDKDYVPLTKIVKKEPCIGIADYYNGRLCPRCGRIIQVDYVLLRDMG